MRLIRKVHRYFALVLGLAIFAWIGSGVMMMLPEPTPDAVVKPEAYRHDFAAVTLAPADVIRRFTKLRGAEAEIFKVVVRPLKDRLVYEVRARGRQALLFDSRTGKKIEVTPELAAEIAQDYLEDDVGQARIERLDRHTTAYPWGPLPVYRLEFEKGRGTIAYVALADASLRFTDRQKQLWHLLTGFHTFDPLRILSGSDTLRHRVLLIAAILSFVIVITGYCMEFFFRSNGPKKSKSGVQ